jgi:thioesterase component of yersiniabactin synthetase
MNSRRRGAASSEPEKAERRAFVAEMQALAAAGGTEKPPPVLTAEEIMTRDKPVENDFSAALNMASESMANVDAEDLQEEEVVEEEEADLNDLDSNFTPDRWIIDLNTVKRPSARLLIFHGIGQSHMFYRKWQEFFTLSDISLHCVCLPGRSFRLKETPVGVVDGAKYIVRAIDQLYEDKKWLRDTRLFLFGHCLGAIIAFEVAKHYNEHFDESKPEDHVEIQHLVVSSCKGPSVLHEHNLDRYSKKWWLQSDSDIMTRAAALGGVPVVLRDKNRRDLLRAFVPCIRQDFQAFEKWLYEPMERRSPDDRGSIDCPVTSFHCQDDKAQLPEEVQAWEEATDYGTSPGQVNQHYSMFMGGHSWLLIPAKEDALKSYLELLCLAPEPPEFDPPAEDEEELTRIVETFYG